MREEGDDEDNEFFGLLMKVMKSVDEDDEFSGVDDEYDEFLDLLMNFNVF